MGPVEYSLPLHILVYCSSFEREDQLIKYIEHRVGF